MVSSNHSPGGVTVAVNFDDAARPLIRHASLLAKRLDVPLHFVHAVEPVLDYTATSLYPVSLQGMSEAMEEVGKERQRQAEEKLKSLAEIAFSRFPITTKALSSPFVTEAILSEAISTGASLIVCGVGAPKKAAMLGGFSTALSLMAHSSLAVVIFKAGIDVEWEVPGLRILVADDGRDAGFAALRSALKIAGKTEKAILDHVHVANFDAEDLKLISETALAKGGSPLTASVATGQKIYEGLRGEVESLLKSRADQCMGAGKSANLAYEAHFLSGDVTEAVSVEAMRFKPHMIVFGRHMTVHRRPFSIGAVPFRTMLRHDYPVMLVPLNG